MGKKNYGYPADDENSKLAGCCGDFRCDCSANLDIFYTYQFIQNEETVNPKSGEICSYILEHTPVLNNCVTGTVYYDQVPLYIFKDKDGELSFDEIKEKDKYPDKNFPTVVSGTINYVTGVINLTWSRKINAGKSCLFTSYEYNLECQQTPPKQVECPKCNHKFYDVPACDDAMTLQKLASGEGTLDLY